MMLRLLEEAGSSFKNASFSLRSRYGARLEKAFKSGNADCCKHNIASYAKAEFFTKLPEIDEEIEIVTFVAGSRRYFYGFTFSRW